MGFYNGLWALIIILTFNIDHCYNSKISFPTRSDHNNGTPVEVDESPTKSSIVTATPTPSSSSSSLTFSLDSNSNSDDIVEPLVYSLFPQEQDENNSVIENEKEKIKSERKFLFPESNSGGGSGDNDNGNNEVAEVRQEYIRSLEISDSSENFNPDRKLRYDDERDYRDRKSSSGWNFEENGKRWNSSPDEKTIALQVLDDDPYHHGRPAWPHDEYLVGYFDLKGSLGDTTTRNISNLEENSNTESLADEDIRKFYEWKRLQGNHNNPPASSFIGPGFYDVGSSSDYYGNSVSAPLSSPSSGEYYRYYQQNQPTYQRITTDGGKVQSTSGNSEGSNGEGTVPGATSESSTNTRGLPAYAAYDFYKRKRLRLQIHPGLIAAPLAGLAAFGAASALTSKPLLVELGYVRNKPDIIGGVGGIPGGWGWAGNPGSGYRPYPPFYPPPNPPPHHYIPGVVGTGSVGPGPIGGGYPGGGFGGGGGGIAHAGAHGGGLGGGPIYPVLKPIRSHKPDSVRSSWWNPFAALTPRLTRIPRKKFKKYKNF